MASVRTTFRVIVAAGLIVSLGFAGICATDAAGDSSLRQECPASQTCPCVPTTLHCNADFACHCGQQLPQKGNYPASNSGQPLGLAADSASFTGTAAAAIQAEGCLVLSNGGSSSLVTQGTRLNC